MRKQKSKNKKGSRKATNSILKSSQFFLGWNKNFMFLLMLLNFNNMNATNVEECQNKTESNCAKKIVIQV